MSRIPLRLRLTLAFALAMAAVLAGAGTFLYLRLGDSLSETLDERLETRAEALAAAVRSGGTETALGGDEEEFAQVLAADGDVLAATPGFERAPLLSAGERGRAAERGLHSESAGARLLALPVDGGRVIVVGESLEDRDEALRGLLAQLLIGGPVALVLASIAGYLLAGAALRPVEAMRRRAAAISSETSGDRLPLPPARGEIHRLGATLNEMLDRLDAGLRRERRFVADAGHELRTPLALLKAELELALRRPRGQEELLGVVRSASDEIDRLVRLAEDLLVLAATEEGELPLRRSRLAASELLAGVARRFTARAAAAGRTIEVEAAPHVRLEADRLRLEQTLGNLLDNALRHGAGRVTLAARDADGHVAVRVSDEGPGFPSAFLPRALDRFSRADDARTQPGAGLGLAIVAAVARAHGGSVSVRNRPGGGAEIEVRVPRAAPGEYG